MSEMIKLMVQQGGPQTLAKTLRRQNEKKYDESDDDDGANESDGDSDDDRTCGFCWFSIVCMDYVD